MRPGDVLIVLASIVLVALLAKTIYSNDATVAVRVTQGSHAPADYPAWQQRRITVSGPLGETVIEIQDGRARIVRSPCTKKLCMRTGWLDGAGDITACVPNRVSVALLGDEPRFDAVNF